MDGSTLPHPDSERKPSSSRAAPDAHISPAPIAPLLPTRATPARHGLLMGLIALISTGLIFAVLLSVFGYLSPSRRYLNASAIVACIAIGIYVGFQSWRTQRQPRVMPTGRCPDCGRPIMPQDERCSLCGRTVRQ